MKGPLWMMALLGPVVAMPAWGTGLPQDGLFGGRISKVHPEVGLVRVRVDFQNQRYLNKGDEVEFLRHLSDQKQCRGVIRARASNYLLIHIPGHRECRGLFYLANGIYVRFFSEDLAKNLQKGRKVMAILAKKELALRASVARLTSKLDGHIEEVEAINRRYQVLQDELALQRSEEMKALDEGKLGFFAKYIEAETRLDEIYHKREQYRLGPKNLATDHWSLDPEKHFDK